jgi:hypothetical protein
VSTWIAVIFAYGKATSIGAPDSTVPQYKPMLKGPCPLVLTVLIIGQVVVSVVVVLIESIGASLTDLWVVLIKQSTSIPAVPRDEVVIVAETT